MKPRLDDDPSAVVRPNYRDWALLAVNGAFVAAGLFILPRNTDVGLVTIVLFGFSGLLPVSNLLRKRRARTLRPLRAGIVGGVRITASRWRAGLLGGALVVVGATLIVFGASYPALMRVLAWGIAAVGGVVVIGVLLGRIPAGYLLFTPFGVTIGQRGYAVTFGWDEIIAFEGGEYNDNPLLRVWLRAPIALQVEPPAQRSRALRQLATSEAWMGAPIAVMTGMYSLELPLLIKALERYVADPSSRAELDSSHLLTSR